MKLNLTPDLTNINIIYVQAPLQDSLPARFIKRASLPAEPPGLTKVVLDRIKLNQDGFMSRHVIIK